nr:chaperone protein DnaK [uncultured bacterium]
MVQDAEKFADEDKKRREAAEAKNNADSLVHATEKQLEEHGDKIDAGLKSEIETALAEAKTALEGDDVEANKAKSQALTDAAMKMGQAIYQQEQAAAAEAPAEDATAHSGENDEEVVDAEFSEVDEDNKG